MKKFLSLVFTMLLVYSLKAQTPQLVNFQGVARNSVGNVIANKSIIVRLTVHDGSANGARVYAETRTVTTNAFGLFTIVIGSAGASANTGSIAGINWAANSKYLQLEVDTNATGIFVNAGTTQLVSTPYALFAAGAYPTGNAGGDLTGNYPNPSVATNAITTPKISDGNVTTPKIADNAITTIKITDVSITTRKIADNAITTTKVADANITTPKIADNAVITAKIADNAVTTTKVTDANITTAKIADNAVITAKIADNAVTTTKVADANITTSKLADDAVITVKITDANVTTPKIADAAVTDVKVANGISYSKLSGAPTSLPPSGTAGGDLAGNYPNPAVAIDAITTSKIMNANVTNAKLANDAVTTIKITDANVTTPKIADAAVTDAKVANGISYSKLTGAPASLPPTGAAGGDLTGTYPNPVVAVNTITTAKIQDANITTSKLLNNAVTTVKISDANITTPKIADAAVTDAKVANGISYSKLSGAPSSLPPTGTAGGDLTGNYPNPLVTTDAITTTKIADNAIITAKINDANVTTPKIADAAVTDAKVANGISYSKLTGAPTSLPPGGAAGGDLSGTYPNPTVANDAITSAKIVDATIVSADISATAAIPYTKLTLNNSVQNSDIVANAITTSKVANGTVTTSKMADSAISGLKLLTYAVQNKHISDGAVTNNKISGTGATSGDVLTYNGSNVVWIPAVTGATGAAGGDLSGTYPNPTVANDAITSAKIVDATIVSADISATAAIPYTKLTLNNSVQNSDIVANAITTSKVANGTVTTSKMADSAISGLKLLSYAVQNKHISDGAVTTNKISPAGANSGDILTYNGTNIAWTAPAASGATGVAGGDLSGTYPSPTVANDAITSAKIVDATIVSADISATAAIPYAKLTLTNSIQNGDITANAITTSKVANGTVTTSKMADSAISGLKLLTYAVQNKHIADGAVTNNKISGTGAATGNVLTYNGSAVVWTAAAGGGSPTGAAGGDLGGTYPNPTVANDAITSAKIVDATIVSADISATAAIPYSKLTLNNSVQNSDIVPNAITTSKVANGTVTTSKMADSAISGLKLLTYAVQNKHISDGAVTAIKMNGAGANTGDVLTYNGSSVVWTPASPTGTAGGDLSGTYPNPTVANDAITSAKVVDGTIVSADISATAAIPYSKLTLTSSIQNIDIVANAITTSKVANGTVTTSKMADSAISGLKLLSYAVQTKHISGIGATTGQVMTYNGSFVQWSTPSGGGLSFARVGQTANAGNTNYSIQSTDQIIGIDMSAGTNFTLNLPPANSSGKGFIIKIEKYNNALLPVLTIVPNGTDKIDNASNLAFGNAGGMRRLYCDGAGNWYAW